MLEVLRTMVRLEIFAEYGSRARTSSPSRSVGWGSIWRFKGVPQKSQPIAADTFHQESQAVLA